MTTKDALAQAGIPYNPDFVKSGNYTRERGYQSALELLDLPTPPSALFVANDKAAFGQWMLLVYWGCIFRVVFRLLVSITFLSRVNILPN